MEIRVDVFDSFAAARDPWKEFQRQGTLYVFQTFEWLESWYVHVGKTLSIQPCFVGVYDEAGRPIAFFPFQIDQTGFTKVLRWMGGTLADYGAPILGPAADVNIKKIWAEVLERLPPVDLIWLSKIPERIGERRNPLCGLRCHRYHNSAHFVELTGNWTEFYEKHAGSKTRSTDRRKQRRLQDAGELSWKTTDGGDGGAFREITQEMVKQKSARYRELHVPNMLGEEKYRNFFIAPANELRKSRMLHVSALKSDEEVITTHWGMKYRDRFYYFMPSIADGRWMKYSPGRLLLFDLFRWCLDNGIKVFDFTIGDEYYKKDWCDQELRLYHYFEARTWKGKVLGLYRRACSGLLANRAIHGAARKVRSLFH